MPFGDVWSKWRRHGTGDGYYFLFDALPPQVALRYAVGITEAVGRFNRDHPDLTIRLRQVLALGDVEWVEDQILSEAFAVAERLISYGPFKEYARELEEPAALAMSDLYHLELGEDLARECTFPELRALTWTPIVAIDKHDQRHPGYVLGPGWEEPAPGPPPAPRMRVVILIGHSPADPLPSAAEMAKAAAVDFQRSGLQTSRCSSY